MTALRLYAVAALNGESRPLVSETLLILYRDLGAVVRKAPYARVASEGDDEVVAQHHVVEEVFAHHAVLPAPPGVIFRDEAAVVQWMELHYAALADGLTFVDGRCVARLHVSDDEAAEGDSDPKVVAAEMFRELRREASATLPLRAAEGATEFSAAFLIEHPRWEAFSTAVAEAAKKQQGIKWEITGPWPAYDFVQMKFAR